MARIHRGRRLSNLRALACRRLGDRQSRWLASSALLGGARWAMARDVARRHAADRSRGSSRACELLRGGRFRALGGPSASNRIRMGGCGNRRRGDGKHPCLGCAAAPAGRFMPGRPSPPNARRCLGMDPECLSALSRLPRASGGAWRIQRQVHGRPAGFARRFLRDSGRARARDLSQFFLSSPALAVHGAAPCLGDRMMWTSNKAHRLPDVIADPNREFAASVIEGLSKPRKSLSCRFFYDARGSELFEEITCLPEYYPTRTEIAILDARAAEIARRVDDAAVLVEFGSGSSRKTEILLASLPRLRAYVPIDVSESALEEAKRRLIKRFPALAVRPIAGDFSRLLALPPDLAKARKLGFFPGSTIGNFSPTSAVRLLHTMRDMLSPEGHLIIVVDLKKEARKLVRAYDD